MSRDAVELTQDGVPEDRRFYVIDGRDRMVNGKRLGRLVQLRFDPGDDVELGETVTTTFFSLQRDARLVLGPFSELLSEHAGEPLRLVQPSSPAMDRGPYGAFSLLSAAALDGYDPRRFRMLFGVEGIPAHAEDDWIGRQVRIGDAVVEPISHTGRCLITSQDPDTGIADMDMLDVIRRTRPEFGTEPLPFGVHGRVNEPGSVRLGDSVTVG